MAYDQAAADWQREAQEARDEVETWKARVGRANQSRHYAEREFHRLATELRVLQGRLRALLDGTPVRVGTLSSDERCHRCGGENVNWCAPSPLWNLVMRGNDIDGDPLFNDLVCLRCFVVLAEEAGVRRGQWRLFVDPEPYGLVDETPSGRVWNPKTWMWEEPRPDALAIESLDDTAKPDNGWDYTRANEVSR